MTGLPRQAPTIVNRTRISAWLARHAELPLRFLAGSAGTGKTTAIVGYLATRSSSVAYLALKDDETLESLRERFSRALEFGYVPASFDALLAALATIAPCEIAIDDIDRATHEALDELAELAAEAPAGISFIYAARARSAVDMARFLPRGLGALVDGPQLAFDADDVARLAELSRVGYAPADVTRLLEETEGWPLVASWAIRDAAESGATLAGAYERWRRSNGRHFREYLGGELRRSGDTQAAEFRASLRGARTPAERERLERLEALGLFVFFSNGAYRPYRVARQFDLEAPGPTAAARATDMPSVLVVRMFGRFEAEIGGRRIEWIRRREASLFKFLLLKPSGTATRVELREIFWPEADRHLATQSIRTACSNIRKALAAVVGYASVDHYFSSRGDVTVNLEHAVIDARRFVAHLADGDAELERGRAQEAFAHYRAAQALYSGELFSGEYPEPWYAARAEMYNALYAGLLERIAEHHKENGRGRHARGDEKRLEDLRPPKPSLHERRRLTSGAPAPMPAR